VLGTPLFHRLWRGGFGNRQVAINMSFDVKIKGGTIKERNHTTH